MSDSVIDASYARFSGAQLASYGYAGIVRYACAGRDSVNVTAGEYVDLARAGRQVAITVEHEANWLLGDPGLIRERCQESVAITRGAGVPDGPSFLACDFDATLGGPPVSAAALGNMSALIRGLEAAAGVLGSDTGLYGGAYVIDYVSKHSMIGWYWQTVGWSGGWLHPKACLYQDRVNSYLAGQSVDFDTIERPNWGARNGGTLPPKPTNSPTSTGTANVKAIQAAVHAPVDGIWGPTTDRNCELVRLSPNCFIPALQQYSLGFTGSQVDGIVGPATVLADIAAIQGIQKGLGVTADGKWGPATQAAYVAASPYR